jgi:ankyrin repeat protein
LLLYSISHEHLPTDPSLVNTTKSGETPLYWAIRLHRLDIVKILINHGSDIHKTVDDQTPLIVAAKEGQLEITEFLLQSGAKVGWCNLSVGLNAIHFAIFQENSNLVRCLASHGITLFIPLLLIFIFISALAQNDMEALESPSIDVGTPLMLAICNRQIEVIPILIENGANPNTVVINDSALYCACKLGDVEVIELLIQLGANVNSTEDAWPPLVGAFKNGSLELVKLLVEKYGANLNSNQENCPLLSMACKCGSVQS